MSLFSADGSDATSRSASSYSRFDFSNRATWKAPRTDFQSRTYKLREFFLLSFFCAAIIGEWSGKYYTTWQLGKVLAYCTCFLVGFTICTPFPTKSFGSSISLFISFTSTLLHLINILHLPTHTHLQPPRNTFNLESNSSTLINLTKYHNNHASTLLSPRLLPRSHQTPCLPNSDHQSLQQQSESRPRLSDTNSNPSTTRTPRSPRRSYQRHSSRPRRTRHAQDADTFTAMRN